MAVKQYVGSNIDPIKQGTVRKFVAYKGETTIETYKGQREQVKALYDAFVVNLAATPQYDTINFDPGKGLATLTLTTVCSSSSASQNIPRSIAMYEVYANELSNPIQSAPQFVDMTNAQMLEVLKAIDALSGASGEWTTLQTQLYGELIHGHTEYFCSQYVLRETITTSNRLTVYASFADVNRVVSPPDQASANVLIGAVEGLMYWPNDVSLEWLKKSPIVRMTSAKTWEIITEWWGADKWSKLMYGGTLEYT